MKSSHADAKAFIEIWQESENLQRVCEALGIKPASASQRATNLRKRGVRLKHMPRNNVYDMNELKDYALSFIPEGEE